MPFMDIDPAGPRELRLNEHVFFPTDSQPHLVFLFSYDLSKGGGLASRMQGSDPHAYQRTRFLSLFRFFPS